MKPAKTPILVRLFVAVMFCLSGCVTMWVLLGLEPDVATESEFLTFVLCAGFGACVSGLLFAPMIGKDRPRAWISGALGAVFGTLAGAGIGGMALAVFSDWPQVSGGVVGSFILIPQMGIAAIVIVVFAMFLSLAGPVWLAMMVIAHFATQRLRRRFPTMVQASVFD